MLLRRCRPLLTRHRRCLHSSTTDTGRSAQAPQPSALDDASTSGLFGHELLQSPDGLRDLQHKTFTECAAIKKRLFFASDSHSIVAGFDDLSNTICLGADLTECVHLLHQDIRWKQVASECMESYVRLVESLNTNHDLYSVGSTDGHNKRSR